MDFRFYFYYDRNVFATTIWSIACWIFMTGWGFFLFYTTLPKSEPLDWSKIGRNHDQMVNKLKFDQMSRRIDEVEKVSYSNI